MLKKFLILAALLASGPAFGQAQTLALARAVTACGGQSLTNGSTYPVTQDLTGKLCDGSSGGGGGSVTQGTVPWVVSGQGTAGTAATGVVTVQGIAAMTPLLATVSQPTAANLNATVVGTGTFVTQATLAAETTKVIGTVNQGTSPWVVSGTVTANITPSSSSSIGITPVVSAAAEATHVLKAGAGNAYAVYATNLTSTQGFLLLINATSAPADGAVTPLACAPLAPNGVASLNYAPGPPGVFSTGITAVVTSAVTCFTKTTGVITAFISGSVQ